MHRLENRIPPPLVATLCAALMWGASRYLPGLEVADTLRIATALIVLLGSLFICLAGVASFKRAKTTVNPLKPHTSSSLVSSGIYRYTRNPMYLGFAGALVAWAIFLASPASLLGVLGFVLYMNRFQIEPEQRALTALFGAEFTDYQSRVRKWI